MKRFFLVLALLIATLPQPAWAQPGLVLSLPVTGSVLRSFDDVGRYEAGHRGVDLQASIGSTVRAAALGKVHFVGSVAGVPTVSLDHGNGWRTTYQPVKATVMVGDTVATGDAIGTLGSGHCASGCLHWGLTNGTDYADPLSYTETPIIRLLPRGTQPRTVLAIAEAQLSGGDFSLPVNGSITSAFGMRLHPITGISKLHDGTDFGAGCGQPIVAPAVGVVKSTGYHPAYGYRVFLDHGNGLVTSYNHLPQIAVAVGTQVQAGQRIGSVGTTGLSTGCHLHWMAWRSGELIDPMTLTH